MQKQLYLSSDYIGGQRRKAIMWTYGYGCIIPAYLRTVFNADNVRSMTDIVPWTSECAGWKFISLYADDERTTV